MDTVLEVGENQETVKVEESAVQAETTSTQLGDIITGTTVEALPLNGPSSGYRKKTIASHKLLGKGKHLGRYQECGKFPADNSNRSGSSQPTFSPQSWKTLFRAASTDLSSDTQRNARIWTNEHGGDLRPG